MAESPNPFPGLRPFEFEENHLFFGRDGQTDELLSRLRQHRFLAVLGTSGSGKSSLVRAGLLPDIYGGLMAAAGSSWHVALFKPGNDPLGNLAQALSKPEALASIEDGSTTKPIVESTLRRSALGLIEVVRQEKAGGNLLIVADQFEEIFRFQQASTAIHPDDEAAAFVRLLLEGARQSNYPIYVVLTMRSDYLGDCARFAGLPEAINEGLYLIPRMTRDQRREAITGPVAVGGGEISPRLVNRLLNDVGDNPDQLPIMQHALMRMWDCWQSSGAVGPIDLPHYEQIGTFSGALSQQADEAFNELTPRGQQLAPKIFKRLTEKGGDNREVRRPATLSELVEVTGGSEAEVKGVIETFRQPGRSFLIPPADRLLQPESLIDISHESLIRGWSRLRAWVDEEAASAEVYSRLAETAQLHEEGKAGLWRDPDLQLALDWRERTQPTSTWAERYYLDFDQALTFLDQSRASRDAEIATREHDAKIRRQLRYGLFVALVVGCIVSWVFLSMALSAKEKAETAKKAAEEQYQAARSAALRVRKQNLADKSTVVEMAERLVELTPPEEAAIWLSYKGSALSQMRNHEAAIETYEAVLELEPQNAPARFSLGYHHLFTGKADKALDYTDAALKTDPRNWSAYHNRAIALAGMGRYDEAKASLGQESAMFHYSGIELEESELAPEIQAATGRTVIVVDESTIHAASLPEAANLEAFAGGDAFEQRVKEATARTHAIETYLTAVNWCWLQMKFRPEDYGALAAQGVWWEEAGFKYWAKRAFDQFQSRHSESHDARYTKLAALVSRRLQKLAGEKMPEEQLDAQTLAFDAWDYETRNRMDEARDCLDRVVKLEPGNIRYLLLRAAFSDRRARSCESNRDPAGAAKYYEAVKVDCDAILKRDPKTASAYAFRADANARLNAAKAEIEADLRKAIEYEPSDANPLFALADLIDQERPDEALRLLKQALKANVASSSLPWIHVQIAKIHQAQGRLPEAIQSIDSAIALKSNNAYWYETRAEMERKLGRPDSEINQDLAIGYRHVGETAVKRGKHSDAFSAYWSSLEALATSKTATTSPQEQRELGAALTRISALIERLGSREKAAEFWRVVNESGRLPDLKSSVTLELERLAKDPRPTPQL
jgi:tetratricopeptide (TPR) repeat protein